MTPIITLFPAWMAERGKYNGMASGPEAEQVWAQVGEIEAKILALSCIGPADFAAKYLVIEDISPLADGAGVEDIVDREACALVIAAIRLGESESIIE
jgi:hypothetical protein